jgi:predicted nucleotidyltransferase
MKQTKDKGMDVLNAERILEVLDRNAERLRAYHVRKIGLFGSFLHHKANRRSDIDLLVELGQISFDGYMDLKFFLEELFGRKVDLVIQEDVKPALQSVLKEAIYAEGV